MACGSLFIPSTPAVNIKIGKKESIEKSERLRLNDLGKESAD